MTVSANEEKIAEKRGKCGKRVLKNGTFVLEERGKAKNIFAGIQKCILFFCNQRQGGTRNEEETRRK